MRRILAIWLPDWPVQRLVGRRPELKDHPIVLYHENYRGRFVSACSIAAREVGVCEGMSVSEAAALIREKSSGEDDSPSSLHLEPHDPKADRAALEMLARRCHQFSPHVGLEDASLPETLLLDVTGIGSLFGGEQSLVAQVARGLQQLKLKVRIALADTIGTAWGISHFGCHEYGYAESNIVEMGGCRAEIEHLPIESLRLPDATVETLGRLGIKRVGELFVFPRVELQVRFGSLLLQRLDQALGADAETFCSVQSPLEFRAEWMFESPVQKQDAVNRVIELLLERLAVRLAAAGKGALLLTCQLDCHPAPSATVEVGLYRPSASASHLLRLLGMQMEKVVLQGPVNNVVVGVTKHSRLEWRQQGLFDDEKRECDSLQAASLIDGLASRLGDHAVFRCVLRSDPQPDKAYRRVPLIDQSVRSRKTRSTESLIAPLDRPLQLLRCPIRLRVFTTVAETTGRVPARFYYDGRTYDIDTYWGPERIETGWWRKRGVQQDYYRVQTKCGHRFWLFWQFRSGDWFLHGVY